MAAIEKCAKNEWGGIAGGEMISTAENLSCQVVWFVAKVGRDFLCGFKSVGFIYYISEGAIEKRLNN